jgi:hypothetical protein
MQTSGQDSLPGNGPNSLNLRRQDGKVGEMSAPTFRANPEISDSVAAVIPKSSIVRLSKTPERSMERNRGRVRIESCAKSTVRPETQHRFRWNLRSFAWHQYGSP